MKCIFKNSRCGLRSKILPQFLVHSWFSIKYQSLAMSCKSLLSLVLHLQLHSASWVARNIRRGSLKRWGLWWISNCDTDLLDQLDQRKESMYLLRFFIKLLRFTFGSFGWFFSKIVEGQIHILSTPLQYHELPTNIRSQLLLESNSKYTWEPRELRSEEL